MGEPGNVYSSDTIDGQNAATTTRSSHRTYQLKITDSRGPSINGFHRLMRGRLWKSVDGRCRGPGTHCMDTRMDPRGKIVTDNTEKLKSHTINFRHRDGSLIVAMRCTGRSGGNPQTQICGHVIRQHTKSSMD